MHFIPCAIYFYLGQCLSSPLGPMNSASFFAVSALTKNTRSLGSLSLTPGQVSFLVPPALYPCTPDSNLFFCTTEMKRVGNNSSVFGSVSEHRNSPNNRGVLALEATDME